MTSEALKPNPTELREIIERLEKLTGGDREVDCHVAVALSIAPDWWTRRAGETLYVKASGAIGPEIAIQRAGRRKSPGDTPLWYTAAVYRSDQRLPDYTASLDAAVALVEKVLPGWNFTVASTKVPGDARPWADVASPAWIAGENDAEQGEGYGATPAIALLIALFRALEQKP